MALVLIVETGEAVEGANSYASLAEAILHHEARLHASGWDDASGADREKALAHATRFLDGNVRWQGTRVTADQSLAWPREGVVWDGHPVERDSLPGPVKSATCELAGLLLAADLQAEQSADNISELGLGQSALVIRFKDSSKTRRMPIAIGELLQGLGAITGTGGINTRPVVR